MIDKRISYRYGGDTMGRNTSPSRGPAGGASSGGNYGGNTGGGGGGRDRHPPAPTPKPTPKPTPAPSPHLTYKDPDPVTETVPGDVTPKKTYTPPVRHHGIDIGEEPYEMVGGVKVPLSMRGVKGVDPREDPDQYFEKPGRDPFEVPEDKRTIEEKRKIEDWEKGQDWDLIKDLSKKGYDFGEIQDAVEKGLTVKAPTTDTRRQNLIDFGLRTIMPETGLEKSLLNRMKSFVPGVKTGLSSLTDKIGGLAQYFNPQKMMMNFALSKMGLGFLNPLMGLASLMGFNPFKNIGTRYAGVPYKKGPTIEPPRDGPSQPQNVMQASIQKFQPTDQQTAQMNEIMRKRMILQGYADKGALNEKGQNTLTQMNQMISQYQVNPESIFRV